MAATVRWRIPGQSEAKKDDIVTCAWRANYTSAVQHRGEVEAVLRDQASRGQIRIYMEPVAKKLWQAKPDGLGRIDTADSDLMHHQYRLSVLQWNPGPARRNPTNIVSAACGEFHAAILP